MRRDVRSSYRLSRGPPRRDTPDAACSKEVPSLASAASRHVGCKRLTAGQILPIVILIRSVDSVGRLPGCRDVYRFESLGHPTSSGGLVIASSN